MMSKKLERVKDILHLYAADLEQAALAVVE
jgi:hypothetical protein